MREHRREADPVLQCRGDLPTYLRTLYGPAGVGRCRQGLSVDGLCRRRGFPVTSGPAGWGGSPAHWMPRRGPPLEDDCSGRPELLRGSPGGACSPSSVDGWRDGSLRLHPHPSRRFFAHRLLQGQRHTAFCSTNRARTVPRPNACPTPGRCSERRSSAYSSGISLLRVMSGTGDVRDSS